MNDSRRPAVVLVEDQPRVQLLLERVLPDYPGDLELINVLTARETMGLLAERLVPLVILPYELAEGDGLELAAAIRAASPSTKIILTALSPLASLVRNAQAAGVDYLVLEPFARGRFEETVRHALGIEVRVVSA